MTPKEKAEELIDRYIQLVPYYSKDYNLKKAKESALIAVTEIIDTIHNLWGGIKEISYWYEVKEEINTYSKQKISTFEV